MTTTTTGASPFRLGPTDRRLLTQCTPRRSPLVAAVLLGVASAAAVIVQMLALASILARSVAHHTAPGQLLPAVVVLVVSLGVRALGVGAQEVVTTSIATGVTARLQQTVLVTIEHGASPAMNSTGELTTTATRGVEALEAYFSRYLPSLLQAAVVPLLVLGWALATDPLSGVLLLALVGILPIVMVLVGRQSDRLNARQWRSLGALSARYYELIDGLATLRAYGAVEHGRREVVGAAEQFRRTTMAALKVAFRSALALEFLSGVGVGLVAMVLGFRLLDGSISLEVALGVLLVAPELFAPVRRLGAEFHAAGGARAAAERLFTLIDAAPKGTEPYVGEHLGEHVVKLHEVTVDRTPTPFGPVTLEVSHGDRIQVVGPSGSGKTTVLELLAGVVHPSGGTRAAAPGLRCALVPQFPHVFSGTLAENLLLGRPDATEADLKHAIDLVDLAALVDALHDGLETLVGDGGTTLSAGEAARVGLARALVSGAELILLDEVTAHLDPSTVTVLQERLVPALAGRTIVWCGHRASLFTTGSSRTITLPATSGLAQ